MMRIRPTVAATLSIFVSLAACAATDRKDPLQIVDFGIYSQDRAAPELIATTDDIPATVGTVFGIRVVAASEHSGDYDFRWTFPEMQNPADGQVWTEMTGSREVNSDEPQAFLVRINNAWEAKPGPWTVQLSKEGRVVTEMTFTVSSAATGDD